MSMDDVYERARRLEQELSRFNDSLRASFTEVEQSHSHVAPLWDDSMRREYDVTWKPLEETMHDYMRRVGPRYVEFLIERLRHLNSYLHGHGS